MNSLSGLRRQSPAVLSSPARGLVGLRVAKVRMLHEVMTCFVYSSDRLEGYRYRFVV